MEIVRIKYSHVWLAALLVPSVFADNPTWIGPSNGDWFATSNWDTAQIPTNGDAVTITNGYILLTNATAPLASFAISNATLVFSNWNTALNAATVTVWNAGTMTLPPPFTTSQMSNNICVFCSNFTLNAGGFLLADGRGYAGMYGPGCGVYGNASSGSGGGGYGGIGGNGAGAMGGISYGSAFIPICPGSGGGNYYLQVVYGAGGGAVRIDATGTITIDGVVTANGGNGNGSTQGAGSGGSIYLTCATFGGSTGGILRANGGSDASLAGGGGGGRIAVNYTSVAGSPGVRFSANRGTGSPNSAPAHIGTICFTNATLLDEVLSTWNGIGSGLNGCVVLSSTNTWTPCNLIALSNSTLGVVGGTILQITNDLTVTATGGLEVAEHAILACSGNLLLTNRASLVVYGTITNAVFTNTYGTLVGVTNTLSVASNCWIYPFSNPTAGGSALFRLGGLSIQNGGGIDADETGYSGMYGPGHGYYGNHSSGSSGGGHGGKGGSGYNDGLGIAGGNPYGSSNMPVYPGSGGGNYVQALIGYGGGAVRIEADGLVKIDGKVTANGGNGNGSTQGAGSGGSICLICGSFAGNATGILRAKGGTGPSPCGGGGGGRIAVWIGISDERRNCYIIGDPGLVIMSNSYKYFAGTVSVTNGLGLTNVPPDGAEVGTICFFSLPGGGTILFAR